MSAKARFGLWLYTGTIVVIVLYIALFNPDDALGKSQTVTWLGFRFSTYPGQSAIVQFLGTFIVAMSIMPYLFERRLNGSTPRLVPITATVGSAVVMIGQVIEGIDEISLVPAFFVVILFYVLPVWIVVVGWGWMSRAWA